MMMDGKLYIGRLEVVFQVLIITNIQKISWVVGDVSIMNLLLELVLTQNHILIY